MRSGDGDGDGDDGCADDHSPQQASQPCPFVPRIDMMVLFLIVGTDHLMAMCIREPFAVRSRKPMQSTQRRVHRPRYDHEVVATVRVRMRVRVRVPCLRCATQD